MIIARGHQSHAEADRHPARGSDKNRQTYQNKVNTSSFMTKTIEPDSSPPGTVGHLPLGSPDHRRDGDSGRNAEPPGGMVTPGRLSFSGVLPMRAGACVRPRAPCSALGEQRAQDVLHDAAVAVVVGLARGVDADDGLELLAVRP